MADPANTGDKNHSHRPDVGNLLGVLATATRYRRGGQSQLFGRGVNQALKTLVSKFRDGLQRFLEAERRLVQTANLIGFTPEALVHFSDFILAEVPQFQTQYSFSGNYVVG